jgi:hypothetical protein
MTRALPLVLALVACGPSRRAILAVTPTVPAASPAPCPAVPWRCSAGVPERCTTSDGEARWWPLHPLAADGRPAPCAHACTVDTVAHCAAEVTP